MFTYLTNGIMYSDKSTCS